jgi:hypothetical protein
VGGPARSISLVPARPAVVVCSAPGMERFRAVIAALVLIGLAAVAEAALRLPADLGADFVVTRAGDPTRLLVWTTHTVEFTP